MKKALITAAALMGFLTGVGVVMLRDASPVDALTVAFFLSLPPAIIGGMLAYYITKGA